MEDTLKKKLPRNLIQAETRAGQRGVGAHSTRYWESLTEAGFPKPALSHSRSMCE